MNAPGRVKEKSVNFQIPINPPSIQGEPENLAIIYT
jgi:hypothetical protein